MNFKSLMNAKGLGMWLLASAIGLNLVFQMVLLFMISLGINSTNPASGTDMLQVLVLLACLIGPFVIGWIIAGMAGDGRGPTYGVYGSFGAALPLAFAFFYTRTIFILLMIVVVVAGGLNGGIFGEYMRHRKG
jgi:hypothetical protein